MKKIKSILTALAMLTTGLSLFTPAAQAAESYDGTYVIRNVNSGLCLNVAGGVAADGTNIQQWGTSYANPYDTWRVVSDGQGYYKIYSALKDGNSYVLNTGEGTDATNINVSLYSSNNSDNQLYSLSANADGSFKLISKATGKAVEVKNAYTDSGANVQQWEINGANCQDWELIPVNYVNADTLDETQIKMSSSDYVIGGDVNGSMTVTASDLVAMKRYLIGQTPENFIISAMDVNGDGKYNVADCSHLEKFLLGMDVRLKSATSTQKIYQAIDGIYTDGVSETTNTGYISESYLNLNNAVGVTTSYHIKVETEGVYACNIRYANGGTTARSMAVYVGNELRYWNTKGESTNGWTEWQSETLYLPLKAGVNKITFVSETADGAPNLDYIQISPSTEAESPSTPIAPIIGVHETISQTGTVSVINGRNMESLNRGVSVAYSGGGVLVSWRSLATDSADTTFNVYQNGTLVKSVGANEATNVFVSGASATDVFTVDTLVKGVVKEKGNTALTAGNKNSGQSGAYFDIPLSIPDAQTMPDGTTCTYTPNDCSVGDVDGDGEYEIIVKWDPSNSQDNSKDGYTGTVFLDCYKMNGKQLWRINLGKNIRAGAHYTQFMVYDFDNDGKAELMCKTSDGTYDGTGKCIGSNTADYRTSAGRILSGNEYLTLFDGLTGAELDTVKYEPALGNVSDWGDGYGNRSERYLAGVAYLDGENPSAIFSRGYYARTAITAYDVKDKKIVKRWAIDSGTNSSVGYFGQGNHNLVVMDVDTDGKDEIVFGSCCIESDGSLKYSTKLGHGDCMQAGDLLPDRPGLEVFQVHEETKCMEIHDAATGEILFRVDGTGDVGRGMILNMDSATSGMEFTSVADSKVYYYDAATKTFKEAGYSWNDRIKWGMNSAVWWDGDLEREALDRAMVEKPTSAGASRVFTGDGASYINGSKSNACLSADIFGDWREELIFYTDNGAALRVFTTTIETSYKNNTLMNDSQYRTSVAAENVAYNCAPNTSYFLGS